MIITIYKYFRSHESFEEIILHRYNEKVLPKFTKLEKTLILSYGNVSST